ncbi:MAG: hypothetical protein IPL53_18585 [Ignavibacteria bacterium]|nr:hypothetical protein [Ignavibacteria bacterium]
MRFKLGAAPQTLVAYFKPYPDSVDSELFPNQYAVLLMDTMNSHPLPPYVNPVYWIENPNYFLPVELSVFNSNVNKNTVVLNWTTTSETNNQGFDIQRQEAGGEAQDVWVKPVILR